MCCSLNSFMLVAELLPSAPLRGHRPGQTVQMSQCAQHRAALAWSSPGELLCWEQVWWSHPGSCAAPILLQSTQGIILAAMSRSLTQWDIEPGGVFWLSQCFMLQDYKADEDPALFQSVKTKRGPLGPNWKVLRAVVTALQSLYQQKNKAYGSFRIWLTSSWGTNILWPSTSPMWHPSDISTAPQSFPVPPASHQNLSQEGKSCVCHTRDPTGIKQPTAVPWSESQGVCQEQPQVTD